MALTTSLPYKCVAKPDIVFIQTQDFKCNLNNLNPCLKSNDINLIKERVAEMNKTILISQTQWTPSQERLLQQVSIQTTGKWMNQATKTDWVLMDLSGDGNRGRRATKPTECSLCNSQHPDLKDQCHLQTCLSHTKQQCLIW